MLRITNYILFVGLLASPLLTISQNKTVNAHEIKTLNVYGESKIIVGKIVAFKVFTGSIPIVSAICKSYLLSISAQR